MDLDEAKRLLVRLADGAAEFAIAAAGVALGLLFQPDQRARDPFEGKADAVIGRTMSKEERAEYERWLDQPGITTPDSDEMVIAFKIAGLIGRSPTTVIHAARNQGSFPNKEFIRRLDQFVEQNLGIRYRMDGRVRRLAFVGAQAG